jgi:hypothetical protein
MTHHWPPPDAHQSDWMAVAIVCLHPLRRSVLDDLAGASRPVRPRDLSYLGCDDAIALSLVTLWRLKLVTRDRYNEREVYYRVVPDVVPLLSHPSLGGRGGRHCDLADGCAILKTARRLVVQEVWPGPGPLVDYSGIRRSSVMRWMQRLKLAGMWPDTAGLSRYAARAAVQRIAQIKKNQITSLVVPDVAPLGSPRRSRLSNSRDGRVSFPEDET